MASLIKTSGNTDRIGMVIQIKLCTRNARRGAPAPVVEAPSTETTEKKLNLDRFLDADHYV
jgi:hypothetical protein